MSDSNHSRLRSTSFLSNATRTASVSLGLAPSSLTHFAMHRSRTTASQFACISPTVSGLVPRALDRPPTRGRPIASSSKRRRKSRTESHGRCGHSSLSNAEYLLLVSKVRNRCDGMVSVSSQGCLFSARVSPRHIVGGRGGREPRKQSRQSFISTSSVLKRVSQSTMRFFAGLMKEKPHFAKMNKNVKNTNSDRRAMVQGTQKLP
mmetsp:Transcript_53518/g.106187  ORF Transcript_53518/g.106187 Transcript_53518/m.106187 type:complete len:205 (-) Transcript_53518:70-684(-)